jgi:16S rRNA (guanine966-N2)-methyltransferase
MRIVGGRLGGRRLVAEPPPGVRPTADRVREAVASALAAKDALEGARVLDLFAGTGALAFEALSRGASFAVLAEKNAKVRAALSRNAEALGVAAQVKVVPVDLLADPAAAARTLRADGPYDLIFADPPYVEAHGTGMLLDALIEASALRDGGLVVLEGPSSGPPPPLRRLAPSRVYRYGDTLVSFLEPSCKVP